MSPAQKAMATIIAIGQTSDDSAARDHSSFEMALFACDTYMIQLITGAWLDRIS